MKKSTLIYEVHMQTKYPKANVEKVVNSMIDVMTNSLKEGDSVSLYGFGSFLISKREAKEVFLPGSSIKVKVPSKTVVKFKPSKKLKTILEEEEVD